ncbi:hypothetical protein GFH48_06060 [Streptomyces fagopyri]|uniref:Uncharacterized protein n=1 Tax=Streptomyces fagopyri TaxID=2662397 RepID=A0A5Q0L7I2_9ACTN|nr:hypothetical protein [Streptomyces fagopyri]QFZ72891.1 hypothetical protein GFH48_06060 [Streptomyces fagopyri]
MEQTPFPRDLVRFQVDWNRTYDALAAPCPVTYAAHRRRLLRLSALLWRHPFWSRPGGTAARADLRREARLLERQS